MGDDLEYGPSPEEVQHLRHLRRIGYLSAVEQLAKRLSAPIWWEDPASEQVRGGSVCFVNTGRRLIGLTAAHVHREIVGKRQDYPELHCQVGAHTFAPEERLIDIDDAVDIATYNLSEIQTNAANADVHHAPAWPPPVDMKDVHLICGWVWSLARSEGATVTHKFLHIISRLASVHADRLSVAAYTSRSIAWGDESLPPDTNLGGMSGGPVYRLNEQGLSVLTLAGIVYQYQPSFEIVFARPLNLVTADGMIVK